MTYVYVFLQSYMLKCAHHWIYELKKLKCIKTIFVFMFDLSHV